MLTEDQGPWMILATSFAGPGAELEANNLVQELRDEFRLPAYLHKECFDLSQPLVGLGLNRYGGPKMMRHRQQGVYNEWAVLAGNFLSVDDPSLQKTLSRIKYDIWPKSLSANAERPTTQRFAGLRAAFRRRSSNPEYQRKGPMGNAFVTRNPMLPKEFFTPKGLDKFVLGMNKNIKFSLLDCPGRYTVQVATFRGKVVFDQHKVKSILGGEQMESQLGKAAEKAHKLTEALRNQGVEAYIFHNRHDSIVTIGSYHSMGQQRSDGSTEINPAIHRIMQRYGAQQQTVSNSGVSGLFPKSLAGIPFDVQPVPVEVPKPSIGSAYAPSRLLGL